MVGQAMTGGFMARRGYRVLLVKCRGTFGSGGTFEPFTQEADDAADIVAWMRERPWFDGRFATQVLVPRVRAVGAPDGSAARDEGCGDRLLSL